MVNPASTGIDNFLDIKLSYRNQWSGFTDAPNTNYFGVNGYLQKETQKSYKQYSLRTSNPFYLDSLPKAGVSLAEKLRHGIGANVVFDNQGPFEQISAYINYALHFPLGDKTKLSIGVSGNVTNQRLDLEKISLGNPDDDEFYQSLIANGGKSTFLDVNTGVMLYGKSYYISYAAFKAYRNALSTNEVLNTESQIEHKIMAGIKIDLNPKVKLLPSVLYLQNDMYKNVWEASLKTLFRERTWAGLSYKSTHAVVFMGGVYINNLINLSYSFDYLTADLNNYTNGSHEITLALMLYKKDLKAPFLW